MVSVNYSGSYLNPLQVCWGCSSLLCNGSSTDPVGNLVLGLQHTKRQKAFFFWVVFIARFVFTRQLWLVVDGENEKIFYCRIQSGPNRNRWRQLIKEKSCQTLTGIRLVCLTTVRPVVISLTNYSVHAETDSSLLFMSQLYPGCSSTLFLLQGCLRVQPHMNGMEIIPNWVV